jgi:hypothetical protein
MDDATNSAAAPDAALRTSPVGTPAHAHPASVLSGAARRVGRLVWGLSAVMLALVALLAPAAAFFAAGIWAAVTYVSTARALVEFVRRYDLNSAFARLDALDAAARVGLVSAGYFAVLCSTTVLAAGILGRGRTRTFLLVGLVLLVPSALAFSLGARLTADVLGTRFGVGAAGLSALFVYALLDAVILGTLLVDTRRRRGQARRRRLRPSRGTDGPASHATTGRVTPMLRFGPSRPIDATLPRDVPDEPEPVVPQLQLASDPSIVSAVAEVAHQPARDAPEPEDAEAPPLAGVGAQTPPGA